MPHRETPPGLESGWNVPPKCGHRDDILMEHSILEMEQSEPMYNGKESVNEQKTERAPMSMYNVNEWALWSSAISAEAT